MAQVLGSKTGISWFAGTVFQLGGEKGLLFRTALSGLNENAKGD